MVGVCVSRGECFNARVGGWVALVLVLVLGCKQIRTTGKLLRVQERERERERERVSV